MCTTTTHAHELEKELPLSLWVDIIENISRFNIDSIGFGGGEAFLRKVDLIQLSRLVASKGITVNIVTNATLLSEDFLNAVYNHKDKVIFLLSVDGLEEVNDTIRGRGVFRKIIAAIELLQRHKWTFFITSVLMPQNFNSFVEFLKFFSSNFPDVPIDIQPVIPHNEIYYQRSSFQLDEMHLQSLKEILFFLHQHKASLKLCRSLEIIDTYWDYFTNTLVADNRCKMGTESFNINLRGNIWICGKELEYPLYRYTLEEVLSSNEYSYEMSRVNKCNSPCLAGLVI